MSEYIKREDIKNAIRERFNSLSERVEINTVINMMPHIDIVFCKGCRHWRSDGGALMLCEISQSLTLEDDYCSYGEREGE